MDHKSDLYTATCHTKYEIHQLPIHRLHESDTTASPTNSIFQQYNTLPAWIKNVANATILLPSTPNPKRGTLFHDKELK